jgi:thioredoxin-related protein
MAPVVHGLEQIYANQVDFAYLDIEDPRNDEFKRRFGFRLQPHIFLLDGSGEIVQQWVGLVSGEELEAALQAVAAEG